MRNAQKITKKRETKRTHPELSDLQLVDQSQKNMVDINTIMDRYRKTGMLPQFREKMPLFIDNTGVTSVEEAHALVREANYLFEQIPSQVRKMMDNNPANLVDFVTNPENQEICIKHGLLEAKAVTSAKPAAGEAKETKDTETVQGA
jgi:hypothetical protein